MRYAKATQRDGAGHGGRKWACWLLVVVSIVSLLLLSGCLESKGEALEPSRATASASGHAVTPTEMHCSLCHEPSSDLTQMAVPHPTEQRENCLICHSTGAPFPFSQTHEQALNQACLLCHTPSEIR